MAGGHHEAGSLASDLARVLESGEGADLTLVVEGVRLPAHSFLLSVRSPRFADMLSHDTQEASTHSVEIQDMEVKVARQLLSFLYMDCVPELPNMAPQLLAASDKYQLPLLKQMCEKQLLMDLTVENVASTVVLAMRHACPHLKKFAIQLIREHPLEVMATDGWLHDLCRYPEMVTEVSRLVASEFCSESRDHGLIPTAASPPTANRNAPLSDDAAVSRLRRLSAGEKKTRLLKAASEGSLDKLRMLLAAGADVMARDGDGRTALHLAADRAGYHEAKYLLEHGAEVNAMDHAHNTPLHYATWSLRGNRTLVVKLLLASSANPNARGQDSWTPLHYAASTGDIDSVTALLEAGADNGATNGDQKNPLDLARKSGNLELVDILM